MKTTLIILLLISSRTSFATDKTLLELYKEELNKYPVVEKIQFCAPLDFKTKSPLRTYKTAISREQGTKSKPMFAGEFSIIHEPVTNGSAGFIVDCKTGKYLATIPFWGKALFRLNSRAIISQSFGNDETIKTYQQTAYGYPEIYLWDGKKLKLLKNEIQKH